jgi:hypothetical protein
LRIATLLAAGLLLQAGTATVPAPLRLPDECPRLLLTWRPGMPMPTTPPAETRPSVVAAIWDSGLVLRAASIDRPYGAHVIGTLTARERDELLQSASGIAPPFMVYPDAPSLELAWNRGRHVVRHAQSPAAAEKPTELETLRARVFALPMRRVQELAAPVAVDRWRCPPDVPERR